MGENVFFFNVLTKKPRFQGKTRHLRKRSIKRDPPKWDPPKFQIGPRIDMQVWNSFLINTV